MRSAVCPLMIAVLLGSGACGDDESPGGPALDAGGVLDDAGADGGIDAGEPADATTADFSGLYLLSIQRRMGDPIRFLTTVALTASAGTSSAAFSLLPLKVDSCPEVGGGGTVVGSPIAASDVEVDDASFDFVIADAFIAGEANPILCFALSVDLRITGQAQGDGSLCGDVSGFITLPPGQAFDRGTFGAVPVAPGVVGDANLPDPVTSCE